MPFLKEKPQTEVVKLSEIEKLEIEILKTLEKPVGFDHLEIKDVVRGYRINVVTKIFKEGSFFPIYARPISWYRYKE